MSSKEKFPIVLRFANVYPAALSRMQMHAKRSGGDLDHVEMAFVVRNRVYIGEDFAAEVREEIRRMCRENRDQEVAALERRKRMKAAEARREEGFVPPWHGNSTGPLREAIVTVDKKWFLAEPNTPAEHLMTTYGVAEDGRTVVSVLDTTKVDAFEKVALAFFEKHFPGALRHLRLDLDEETPHFHALLMQTTEKTNKTRGTQTLIQASANPLLKDYELAQDVAGEHFSSIGLVRGEKRAEARRQAREADLPLPDAVRHVSPREYREARAAAIRKMQQHLCERAQDLDLRQAHTFIDEIAIDTAQSEAERAERAAKEKEAAADRKVADAEKRERDSEAYAAAMITGTQAIVDRRIDFQEASDEAGEGLKDGPRSAKEPDERSSLWARIRPAYDRLVGVARQAFRVRERLLDMRREAAEIARRAAVLAREEEAAGRRAPSTIEEIAAGTAPRRYDEASFPEAWALDPKARPEEVGRRLDGMDNRSLRACHRATCDAALLCEGDAALRDRFRGGARVLRIGAEQRGLDLKTGEHHPGRAEDPTRARLHTDSDRCPIRVAVPVREPQLTRG